MEIDFSNFEILVVGDVMLDVYFMGKVQRLSPEAPVPVVHITEKTHTLGGAGNAALNLACLGCKTTLFGIRGADENGEKIAALLDRKDIANRLRIAADHPTITKTRIIGQGQQLMRIDEESAWRNTVEFKSSLIENFERASKSAAAVILSDYGKGTLSDDVCPRLIEICNRQEIPVFVDPKGKDWRRYQNADCVTPNSAEFEQATGIDINMCLNDRRAKACGKGENLLDPSDVLNSETEILKGCQEIFGRLSVGNLLITRGSRGMCLMTPDSPPWVIPTRAKDVFDVSGAGDTVIATLAAGVASGLSYRKSAELANIAAGIVVGKLGTQPVHIDELRAAADSLAIGAGRAAGHRIADMDAAVLQVRAWKSLGETIVFTNGCFDLLHPGHIHILNQAKALGSRLVVGLNTDASIKKIKGENRPIVSEHDRASVLSALSSVDMVVLFGEDTPIKLIEALRPDILVKGADYKLDQVVGKEIVESSGGRVALVPLLKGHSTTTLVNRLRG